MSAHSVFWGEVLMANRMIVIVNLESLQDGGRTIR
jgi:hypothetical protein